MNLIEIMDLMPTMNVYSQTDTCAVYIRHRDGRRVGANRQHIYTIVYSTYTRNGDTLENLEDTLITLTYTARTRTTISPCACCPGGICKTGNPHYDDITNYIAALATK